METRWEERNSISEQEHFVKFLLSCHYLQRSLFVTVRRCHIFYINFPFHSRHDTRTCKALTRSHVTDILRKWIENTQQQCLVQKLFEGKYNEILILYEVLLTKFQSIRSYLLTYLLANGNCGNLCMITQRKDVYSDSRI